MARNKYKWGFENIGGSSRVKITTGADIAHLSELDPKMWTVLSCPVKGLEIDEKSLSYIDCDGDGKIRINDVVSMSKWVTGVLKNPDLILDGMGNGHRIRIDLMSAGHIQKALVDGVFLNHRCVFPTDIHKSP